MSRAAAATAERSGDVVHAVSRPQDASERQAESAAAVVAAGGAVRGWSFASVPTANGARHRDAGSGVQHRRGEAHGDGAMQVHRQDAGSGVQEESKKESADAKAYRKAAETTGQALRKTEAGKALERRILTSPPVEALKRAATTPAGLAVGGLAIAGGVTGLGLAGRPLPFQPPAIPLDIIRPGLSAQVALRGPVDAPTFVGLTITYAPKAPASARAAPSPQPTVPVRSAAEEAQLTQDAIDHVVRQQAGRFSQVVPVMQLEVPTDNASPEAERDTDAPVQRTAAPATSTPETSDGRAAAGPAVTAGLAGSGRPLTPGVRRTMEARFGHDFSAVRLHADQRAATAAASVDAHAFTVGHDIVVGAGRDIEASPHLLAHELTHVVQQGHRADPAVHRLGVLERVGVLLGIVEGRWTDDELRSFVDELTLRGAILGTYDADNRARAVVARWKDGAAGFDLMAPQKILLIREMLDGPTLDGDERAILALLEGSDAGDLRTILGGADRVTLAELEADIHGAERRRLDAFVATRFVGGRDAVVAGDIQVAGPAVPAAAPTFAFDPATLDQRFDSDRSVDELVELIEAFPPADQQRARHHLGLVRRPAIGARIARLAEDFEAEPDPVVRTAIRDRIVTERARRLKTERVLLRLYRGEVPASESELRGGTAASDPARAADIAAALRPEVRTTSTGTPEPFVATLPGETESYEQKVRTALPAIVDGSHIRLVAGRGPAEHADPARSRPLAEFEALGEVSRRETLAVFGGFTTGPPLRADTRTRRGNIHDRFTDFQAEHRRMSPSQRRENARQLVFYFFQSERTIRELNDLHNAAPAFDASSRPRNAEARHLTRVADAFVRVPANVVKLNEIDRNWPAVAQPRTREIWVQRFRGATPEADRLLLWDQFQTLIHEYLHTLAHDRYVAYASSFGFTSNEWNTLIEGVDSLLTEIVWDHVEPRTRSLSLRREVEGAAVADQHPPIEVPHASQRRYGSFTEALRLVDIVGIRNVYAAYFLGLVDRIGGP